MNTTPKTIYLTVERFGEVRITQFDVVKETAKLFKLNNRQKVCGYPVFETQVYKDAWGVSYSLDDAIEKAGILAQAVIKKAGNQLSEAIAKAQKLQAESRLLKQSEGATNGQ